MIKATINNGQFECAMDGNGMVLAKESVMMVRGLFVALRHNDPLLATLFQSILKQYVTSGEIFGLMDGEVTIDLKKARDGHGD